MRDIGNWLEECGFGKYAESFAQSDVDLDVLPNLTGDVLRELGVSVGDRLRLLRAAREYTAAKANATSIHPEEAKRPRDTRLREILDNSPIGVSIATRALNRRLFVNQRFLEMFAADSFEQLEAAGFEATYVHPAQFHRILDDLDCEGAMGGVEVERKRLDGTHWWVHMDAELIEFEGVSARVVWHSDITEQRQAQTALVQAKEAAEEHLSQLKSMQGELLRYERLATLGQLTGTVSHELRNPLGTIKNSSRTLRRTLEVRNKELTERALDRIDRNIARCEAIIEHLLDYARTRELTKVPTDIDDWLRAAVEELELPGAVGVSLDLRSGVHLAVDRERLHQVIVNVVQNALQAIDGEQGEVFVGATATDQRLEIRVRDTGPGIPDHLLPRVFEPLFSTRSFGVGLGLALVRQLMEQHGGGAEFTSTAPGNTTLHLWIPRYPNQSAAAE